MKLIRELDFHSTVQYTILYLKKKTTEILRNTVISTRHRSGITEGAKYQ